MAALTYEAAVAAIAAILAAVPDDELPEISRMEYRDGKAIAWFGGMGAHLGSRTRNGKPFPIGYRESGAHDALVGEATCRADMEFHAAGQSHHSPEPVAEWDV